MEKMKVFAFAGTVLKNLVSKPVTKNYPSKPAEFPERMRGHVEIYIEDCISCGLCARSCPPGAIEVDRKAGTWTINRFDCVQCGNCTNVCPKKCLRIVPGYTEPDQKKHSDTFQKPAQETETTSRVPDNDREKCVYCTLCAKKCPQEALTVDRKAKTWAVDETKCVGCGVCIESCPKKCIDWKK